MSAYIVEKQHIIYLVEAALATCRGADSFRWYWSNPTQSGELQNYDKTQAADVANMLWRENIKSVSHRYPNESSATLPGNEQSEVITSDDFKGVRWLTFEPTQVIKACDCYAYQSCEHDGWKASEAHAFTEYLRARSWTRLPKYDGAVWGSPPVYENAANVVSLMDLARGDAPARFRKA